MDIRQTEGKPKSKNKARNKVANKGKGVLVDGGLKVGCKILKPSNSLSGPSRNLGHKPFDDGENMRPILIGDHLGNICFQASNPKLNLKNHMAVSFSSRKGYNQTSKALP